MKKIICVLLTLSLFILITSQNESKAAGAADTEYDTDTTATQVVCNVLAYVTGPIGKALAAFACMGISLAFLAGKVSWTLILTFSLGMACIFGAPAIIDAFTGGGKDFCSDVTN